jgi:hypothetical protein
MYTIPGKSVKIHQQLIEQFNYLEQPKSSGGGIVIPYKKL